MEKENQKKLKTDSLNKYTLTYSKFPNSLYDVLKKYFISSIHTASTEVQVNQKSLYFVFLLIISAIIIPKWNYIMQYLTGSWSNFFYLPNVTKIYILSLIIALFLIIFVNNYLFIKMRNNILINSLKIIIFILITISIYKWNEVVADWVENAVLYIPHITKIYFIILISFSLINRGIYMPLKRKMDLNYLFPFNWIKVGIIGLSLDLVKAPGYIIGGIKYLFLRNTNFKN